MTTAFRLGRAVGAVAFLLFFTWALNLAPWNVGKGNFISEESTRAMVLIVFLIFGFVIWLTSEDTEATPADPPTNTNLRQEIESLLEKENDPDRALQGLVALGVSRLDVSREDLNNLLLAAEDIGFGNGIKSEKGRSK